MPAYEYKVVPAPSKGKKAKGVKTGEERFALALETLMNELGAQGWDYVRADMLPCEARSGLTGSTTSYMNMLVFRRSLETGARHGHPATQPDYAASPASPSPAAAAAPSPAIRPPHASSPEASAPVAAPPVSAPIAPATAAPVGPATMPQPAGAEVTPFPQAPARRGDAPRKTASDAAAAAAAAALNAYRESQSGPRLEDDEAR